MLYIDDNKTISVFGYLKGAKTIALALKGFTDHRSQISKETGQTQRGYRYLLNNYALREIDAPSGYGLILYNAIAITGGNDQTVTIAKANNTYHPAE